VLFTQIEFLIFIVAVFTFILCVSNFKIQKRFLLIASYYFYGYWDYRFLILILLCTLVNYFAAKVIFCMLNAKIRKLLLLVTIALSLGMLFFFKYFNFFINSLNILLKPLGWHTANLAIILPVGISFFTFQALSYTIDVYQKKITICKDFYDFALYIAFFPQLVAGPIVRASDFLPQLYEPRKPSMQRIYLGFEQFVFGLFKKVFIADNIALFIDFTFDNYKIFNGATLWIAVIAYTIQIYCDFSGYSDMAIGIARAMGYDLNTNFNLPYIAKSLEEFWRRWHISLSTWLRDYLYIPLGGNRKGKWRMYMNLFITMLLGGLWHGAAWTFVFWGALHGIALILNKAFHERLGRKIKLPGIITWAFTILIVMTGWIFFRSSTFTQAYTILEGIITFKSGVTWYNPFVIFVIITMIIYHTLNYGGIGKCLIHPKHKSIYGMSVLFTMIWLIIVFYPQDFQPFLYFQF
jgi:alginate O-acetyltransferase complex protein AlgI